MRLSRKTPFILLLLIGLKTFSQNHGTTGIDSLAGQFIKDLRADEKEKIFVQTDRWFYIAGENVHFSAFCINALSHKISRKSKTIYADLVDDKDNVVSQLLLNNHQQKLEGNILLPPHVNEGYHWLRIYTNAMLHGDRNSICVVPIYIFNGKIHDRSLVPIVKTTDNQFPGQPQFMIFPEGGALISGTTSVIAFRCMDENGRPLEVSGNLSDGVDSAVTKFKTSMPGYGKFDFYVWKSRRYTAHIKWNNRDWSYPLPAVNQFASQLSVTEQNDNSFRVQVSLGDSLYKRNKQTQLLAISRDSLCFAATGNDMYEVILPKANFPEGKATLLLFNDKQQVVSERNIFIERSNLKFNVHPDKEIYGAREKVNLDITAADSNNRPVEALLSMAVVGNSLAKPVASTILTDIINDNIELPQNNSAQYSREQWDIIMLAQKNQYTGWKYVEGKSYVTSHENRNDSSIMDMRGVILDAKDQPLKDRIVTLISKEPTLIFLADTTDGKGNFNFKLPEYYDSTLFTLQVANLQSVKQNDKIILYKSEFPNFNTPVHLKKRFPPSAEEALNYFKTNQLDSIVTAKGKEWLKEVSVVEVQGKPLDYDVTKRVTQNSHIITSEYIEKNHVTNLVTVLQQAPGVRMNQGVLTIGGISSFTGPVPPLLIVDGVRAGVASITYFDQLPPSAIDFIEIIQGPEAAIFGVQGGNGVISVNTKHEERTHTNTGIALMKFYPKGYQNPPPFELPNYDLKEIKKSNYPDQRSMIIYWKGNTITENGKAPISFFTADSKGIYTVTIVGITASGNVIYKQTDINRN